MGNQAQASAAGAAEAAAAEAAEAAQTSAAEAGARAKEELTRRLIAAGIPPLTLPSHLSPLYPTFHPSLQPLIAPSNL